MNFDDRIGAEELQVAAFETVQAQINDFVMQEENHGLALDERIAAAQGVEVMPVHVETFKQKHIYYGHRPSMIEAPVEEYPSMSLMTHMAAPSGSNQDADYGASYGLSLAIEMIVKSGPYPTDDREGVGEDIVGRRIKRTTEAVHRLLSSNPSLGGYFYPPENVPVVRWGEIFAREEDGVSGTGARWYWQGVRLEYLYLKQTVYGG